MSNTATTRVGRSDKVKFLGPTQERSNPLCKNSGPQNQRAAPSSPLVQWLCPPPKSSLRIYMRIIEFILNIKGLQTSILTLVKTRAAGEGRGGAGSSSDPQSLKAPPPHTFHLVSAPPVETVTLTRHYFRHCRFVKRPTFSV